MTSLSNELRILRDTDPDVALVLEAFEDIERVYRASLIAMGQSNEVSLGAGDAADITLSFQDILSTSE